jgi:hypothetical protein
MTVEVLDVGMEDGLEVASPEDEHAIEALTAQSTDKRFRECIRFGSFNRSAEDPQSLSAEDLIEGGYVLGIAIADEEAERARVPACDEVVLIRGSLSITWKRFLVPCGRHLSGTL